MTLDLQALLRALAEADVRYLVVGGVAVAAQGYVRATEDVDLVPDPDQRLPATSRASPCESARSSTFAR